MRGSAISARLLAGIALSHSFLRFFIGLFRIHRGPYTLLMIQTIKQITNRVPSSPYPNMASPSSIQPLLLKGVASTVGLAQSEVCTVTDMFVACLTSRALETRWNGVPFATDT